MSSSFSEETENNDKQNQKFNLNAKEFTPKKSLESTNISDENKNGGLISAKFVPISNFSIPLSQYNDVNTTGFSMNNCNLINFASMGSPLSAIAIPCSSSSQITSAHSTQSSSIDENGNSTVFSNEFSNEDLTDSKSVYPHILSIPKRNPLVQSLILQMQNLSLQEITIPGGEPINSISTENSCTLPTYIYVNQPTNQIFPYIPNSTLPDSNSVIYPKACSLNHADQQYVFENSSNSLASTNMLPLSQSNINVNTSHYIVPYFSPSTPYLAPPNIGSVPSSIMPFPMSPPAQNLVLSHYQNQHHFEQNINYHQHPHSHNQIQPPLPILQYPHSTLDVRNIIFNTGDNQLDVHLDKLTKSVNPDSVFQSQLYPLNKCRFFVIKSFNEENILLAIQHNAWCSTKTGNDRLRQAYESLYNPPHNPQQHQQQQQHQSNDSSATKTDKPRLILLFSVNSSGYFCGVAEITDTLQLTRNIWSHKKWQGGHFPLRWLYVKNVPNNSLRHIKLEHNENRPVTNSRDVTEVKPHDKAMQILHIIHSYPYDNSLLLKFKVPNLTNSATASDLSTSSTIIRPIHGSTWSNRNNSSISVSLTSLSTNSQKKTDTS